MISGMPADHHTAVALRPVLPPSGAVDIHSLHPTIQCYKVTVYCIEGMNENSCQILRKDAGHPYSESEHGSCQHVFQLLFYFVLHSQPVVFIFLQTVRFQGLLHSYIVRTVICVVHFSLPNRTANPSRIQSFYQSQGSQG